MGQGTSSGKASAGAVFTPKYNNLGPLSKINTARGEVKVGDKATVVRGNGETMTLTAVDGAKANMNMPIAWKVDGTNMHINGGSYSLANYFQSGVKSVKVKKAK